MSESSSNNLVDSLDKPFKPTIPPRDPVEIFPNPIGPPTIFPKNPPKEKDAFSIPPRPKASTPSEQVQRLKQDFISGLYLLGAMVALVAVVLGIVFSLPSESTPFTTSSGSPIALSESFGKDSQLSKWVEKESVVALSGILANIGPGCGADDGVVIASPSMGTYEDEPDYYYTWTRDAALTITSLLPHFLPNEYLNPWTYTTSPNISAEGGDTLMEPLLRAFVRSQEKLQVLKTRSGDLWDGGLNEPKYQVDLKAFDGDWGRPQRDGPALRALTLIPYAHYLLDRGYPSDIKYVKERLYDPSELRQLGSVIKNDLEEVGGGWWRDSFDLWEEVDAQHLFTQLVCLRALQAGATLSSRLNDTGASTFYLSQAAKLIPHLKNYYDPDRGIWRATTSTGLNAGYDTSTAVEDGEQMSIGGRLKRERSGLDCALPLAVLHAGGRFAADAEDVKGRGLEGLGVTDPEVLASIREYVLSFEGLYGINQGNWISGWALGRYREDIYNGVGISKGNPWYICTFSVSQVLYQALEIFIKAQEIHLHPLTIPFWRDVLGDTHRLPPIPDEYDTDNSIYDPISPVWVWSAKDVLGFGKRNYDLAIKKLGETAERYLEVGKRYSEVDNGRMSEQIHRHDGSPTGARDLTWSYASFLEVVRARRRVIDLS